MLILTSLTIQVSLIVLAAYNAITALWGWRERVPALPGNRLRKLRVVIPAHDEESVIGAILDDLAGSAYPAAQIWVLADRCRDSTVGIAKEANVLVAERNGGPDGKGAALAWYLKSHPLSDDETLVIFDADNRVPPDVLGRIADELDVGHTVIQCYVDVSNPDDSLMTEASALSYWAGNRMVQLARSNLGWSADLSGTGMAISAAALRDAGGFGSSLTEDQELGARLVLTGHKVEWLHDVRVEDSKPKSVVVAANQRARWMAGKRATAKRFVVPLIKKGDAASIDQALRLIQPSRSFVALLSGGFALLAMSTETAWLLPWQVWVTATAVQVLEPIPFLAREEIPAQRIARYPVLAILAALWIPIRFLSRRTKGWYHTPHEHDVRSL